MWHIADIYHLCEQLSSACDSSIMSCVNVIILSSWLMWEGILCINEFPFRLPVFSSLLTMICFYVQLRLFVTLDYSEQTQVSWCALCIKLISFLFCWLLIILMTESLWFQGESWESLDALFWQYPVAWKLSSFAFSPHLETPKSILISLHASSLFANHQLSFIIVKFKWLDLSEATSGPVVWLTQGKMTVLLVHGARLLQDAQKLPFQGVGFPEGKIHALLIILGILYKCHLYMNCHCLFRFFFCPFHSPAYCEFLS